MNKLVEDKKKWALSRARFFLKKAEEAKDSMDIEANLYGAHQVLTKSFNDFHLLNEFGEEFMVQLETERREATNETANRIHRDFGSHYSPR